MVTGGSIGAKISGQAALTARLMLYGLLAIVLMAMDQRGQYVPRFRSLANYLVEPVYHAMDLPVKALRGMFGFFQSAQSLRRENDQLREDMLQQRGALQRLDALARENDRLRALVDGAAGQGFDFQFAELIEVDLDPFSHRVIIDRGLDKGIEQGQAVIDGAGVMGQVEEVHLHYATIRLISDPNHALPVQINRTGLRTVAFGTGNTGLLNLPALPHEADVREGDLVVTSGLGERFPGGYPVAVVETIERQAGQTFARAQARPLAALDRGREVLLIKSIAPVDAPSTQSPPADESGELVGPPAPVALEALPDVSPAEIPPGGELSEPADGGVTP